jgi:hypothetical protein
MLTCPVAVAHWGGDIPVLCRTACPEMAMIMDQHDKTGFRESPCKSFQAVLLHTGIAVRHRNRRGGTFGAGNEQPTAQRHAALDPELDVFLSAIAICFSPLCSTVVDPVSVGQAAILPRATQATLANDLDLRSATINE